MVLVEHAAKGEQHIIGIEFAAGLEVFGGVEFHPGAQLEGVDQAILGHLPALCQARFDLGAAALELGQAVEDGFRGGVEIGAGGVQAGVEDGGAAFGTEHQVGGAGEGSAGDQPSGKQSLDKGVLAHHDLFIFVLFVEELLMGASWQAMQGMCLRQVRFRGKQA